MAIDKNTAAKLKRYAQAFREARERGANESDTVMFLVKFFEEVLGYDPLAGEISKEVAIKDRYCDIGLKIAGSIEVLVEAKAAGNKGLRERDIEQAENYASRHGIEWVLLTNGIEWQLYHVSFSEGEGEGIRHDLAFETNLLDDTSEKAWEVLGLLAKEAFEKDLLDDFWIHRKALSPASLVRTLFTEPVLNVLRRELNREAEIRLDMEDVFEAVRDVLSKESLMVAGDITLKKRRKKRRAKAATEHSAVSAAASAALAVPTPPMVTQLDSLDGTPNP